MMKVLELGKYYPPYRGGMETLLRSWCEGFAAQGAEVDCVVANDGPTTIHETINRVRVHRLARYGVLLSTALCPRYLRSTRDYPADVWHLNFPNPLGDLAALLGPKTVPLVIHYHSDIIRQAGWLAIYSVILKRLLQRATRIVVATPQHIEFSPWLAPLRAKCEIIPFGIDLSRFRESEKTEAVAARLRQEASGKPILLTIGRLVGYKGHRYLIEAARTLDARVWIVGTGPLDRDLKAQALGSQGNVRFWGDIPDEELPGFLRACDVFVLPSITPNEAFGLVQVEAMACGKPVVSCSLRSGVPFVNQDQITGAIVPPMDSGALARALQQLLQYPELRRQWGEAGQRRAHQEFSEPVMIQRYWDCLQSVVRGASSR
jgi:rhamnosyl/mannosyltransferase